MVRAAASAMQFRGQKAVGRASGAVSALPFPTTQATISSRLSNAAPKAWLSEYPSSPPS